MLYTSCDYYLFYESPIGKFSVVLSAWQFTFLIGLMSAVALHVLVCQIVVPQIYFGCSIWRGRQMFCRKYLTTLWRKVLGLYAWLKHRLQLHMKTSNTEDLCIWDFAAAEVLVTCLIILNIWNPVFLIILWF